MSSSIFKFDNARLLRVVRVGITAAFIATASLSACGGDDDDSSTPTAGMGGGSSATAGKGATAGSGGGSGATFTQVLTVLGTTKGNCGVCHSLAPSASNGGLQFDPSMPSQAYGALVGKMSAGVDQSKCGGKTYVAAGSPSTSLLYGKLTASPPCGVRMPMGGTPLADADIATVSSWISAGALNN
ncbi:MAG TPA: hypothetical protein VGI70_04700 [Polyangiales bacterium]|jgi:hypothetical protein